MLKGIQPLATSYPLFHFGFQTAAPLVTGASENNLQVNRQGHSRKPQKSPQMFVLARSHLQGWFNSLNRIRLAWSFPCNQEKVS